MARWIDDSGIIQSNVLVPNVEAGCEWYVKLPGDDYKISRIEIMNKTEKTVKIELPSGNIRRYLTVDIQWIEKVQ